MRFKQVDVFTQKKFQGNPVAVFFDADDLSTEEMQAIANWTNLSETTFVVKPESNDAATYKVRIFTPRKELPFAGHPTVGTCHAVLEAGLVKPRDGKVFQECKAGLVELSVDNSKISFTAPYTKNHKVSVEQANDIKRIFGSENCACIETGPVWFNVVLPDNEAVLNFEPDYNEISAFSRKYGVTGIQIVSGTDKPARELRTFAPETGVNEDPVCGSGSASVGAMLLSPADTDAMTISQGSRRGRAGQVFVKRIGDKVIVGGHAITTLDGNCEL